MPVPQVVPEAGREPGQDELKAEIGNLDKLIGSLEDVVRSFAGAHDVEANLIKYRERRDELKAKLAALKPLQV